MFFSSTLVVILPLTFPPFLSLPLPPHITVIKVFDASIQPRLFDRLLYIMCSQNWEHCGIHYWIKQCIEVQHVLSTRMYV